MREERGKEEGRMGREGERKRQNRKALIAYKRYKESSRTKHIPR